MPIYVPLELEGWDYYVGGMYNKDIPEYRSCKMLQPHQPALSSIDASGYTRQKQHLVQFKWSRWERLGFGSAVMLPGWVLSSCQPSRLGQQSCFSPRHWVTMKSTAAEGCWSMDNFMFYLIYCFWTPEKARSENSWLDFFLKSWNVDGLNNLVFMELDFYFA